MEHIRKAVERAKDERGPGHPTPRHQHYGENRMAHSPAPSVRDVSLDGVYLESKRIIAHDIRDFRSRSFDMLRTQVLQIMDMRSWQFLGVTSATEGCGKSVVAINLALSIARQPEKSVLLVDLDLQKPHVASYLGIDCDHGITSVLAGPTSLQNALVQADIPDAHVVVLPCEAATVNSSAWIASRAMSELLQEIKQDFANWTVVFDLPPVLAGDDVISILPRLDCVAFVVGAGKTTVEEIKESNKHLESAEIVRVILNKSDEASTPYYYAYGAPKNEPRKKRRPPPKKKSRAPRFQRLSKFLNRLSEY